MKKINLRELYPDVYTTDFFVDVTEEVMETIRAAERAEAAYERKMYRYKAQYSLDCENGIENAVLLKPKTPEMLLEEKQLQEQVYSAVMNLPEKQAKRIYARYYLGMTVNEIAGVEGVDLQFILIVQLVAGNAIIMEQPCYQKGIGIISPVLKHNKVIPLCKSER